MDDEVQVIEEHPPGLPVALAAVRLHALGTKLLVDLLDDGPHLALVAPRTDHEVVGDPDEGTDVEDDDVAGQLRRSRPCGRQRLLHRITHRFRLSIPPFPVPLMSPVSYPAP